MSTQDQPVGIPEWDLTDRLRKSLRSSRLSVQAMADHLDVHRKTVGNYLSGATRPTTSTLRVWAMRCGVPFDWLAYGIEAPDSGPDQGISALSWKDHGTVLPLFPVAA
jgi:transcriptional regulator with XRE-family HTH domain